ncbi:MAG: hypothetical protein H0X30_14635 [Anaerolineae bacterium]|nr:hypothetical protein [Anaerolineae bacterium]
MSRLLLKFTLFLAFILTITSLAAGALGSTQPHNSVLSGFTEGCESQPSPCLYGILPGVTSIAFAQKQLEANGYKIYNTISDSPHFYFRGDAKTETCSDIQMSTRNDGTTVSAISLSGCKGIVLGDLSFLGFPEKIRQGYMKLGHYFVAEIAEANKLDRVRQWSPYSQINSVSMGKEMDLLGNSWHGFVPDWRYCQLEPSYVDCPQ